MVHVDGHRVVLEGEVDLAQKNELTAAVEAIKAGGYRRVVFDLTAVTFVDSTCISAIADLADTCDITVVGANPQALRVMELTGITHIVELEDE